MKKGEYYGLKLLEKPEKHNSYSVCSIHFVTGSLNFLQKILNKKIYIFLGIALFWVNQEDVDWIPTLHLEKKENFVDTKSTVNNDNIMMNCEISGIKMVDFDDNDDGNELKIPRCIKIVLMTVHVFTLCFK